MGPLIFFALAMKVRVLLLLCFLYLALGQQRVDRRVIDNFELGVQSIVITIPQNANFPITDTSIYDDSQQSPDNLLGGERDLQLTAESGPAGRILNSGVSLGEWNVATPNSASGFAIMQWDGRDNSLILDEGGLGGLDFTDGDLADRFHATIETDIDTVYSFTVTSPGGGECTNDLSIPGRPGVADDYFINFSDFSGDCSFTNVGSVEILLEAFDNVDSVFYLLATNGIEAPSPSPSPSRIVEPSQSPTPSPNPSDSATPTPSPSPSTIPPEKCMCHCPAFTCELVFDPDDDENNAYYFDDDDNNGGNASGSGVATSDLTGSDLPSSFYLTGSDAGVIQASVVCVLALAAALI